MPLLGSDVDEMEFEDEEGFAEMTEEAKRTYIKVFLDISTFSQSQFRVRAQSNRFASIFDVQSLVVRGVNVLQASR